MKSKMISLICVLVISSLANAHSHLANPLPTRRLDCRIGNGRPRDCHGPCPPLDTYGEPTGVGPNRPAEVWRRGESRQISWHRNNHGKGESGFVRFTLVPVDKMMDKSAHDKFTFQISCWSAGPHRCPSRNVHVCGNDADGMAHKVPITVPTSYPDGTYVFGWSWYGGGRFDGQSFFSDYWSCSFIKIQGGSPVTASSSPVFVPGSNQQYSDMCIATTNRLGVCTREPCRIGNVKPMRPSGLPRAILRRDIDGQSTPDNDNSSRNPGRRTPRRPQPPRSDNDDRSPMMPFEISGMYVVNIQSNKSSRKRRKTFKIQTSKYSRGFALVLQVTGQVEKVKFEWQGKSRTEYSRPYVVSGVESGRYNPLYCRKGQQLPIKATIYGAGRDMEVVYNIRCT